MSLEDARDLWMELERLKLENSVLKDSLLEERQSTDNYFTQVDNERQAWKALEDALNADIKQQRQGKVKWGASGLVLGALIMAVVD